MIFLRSLPRTFRYLDWIFITAHLGMWLSVRADKLPAALTLSGIFFLLSCLFPSNRPYWQRLVYIVLALIIVVCARRIGIDLALFLFIYFSKSYFLLNRRKTIAIACLTAIPWAISEYFAEARRFQQSVLQLDPLVLDPGNPLGNCPRSQR